MIKTVNKRRYNTSTATVIAEYWNGIISSDFGYYSQSILHDKNGYYILIEGGPFSDVYFECNDCWKGFGYALIPLTEEQAVKCSNMFKKDVRVPIVRDDEKRNVCSLFGTEARIF